jgi:hypothetical protein
MTVPGPPPRRPTSGMDPMPASIPTPPLDDVPDPDRPGRPRDPRRRPGPDRPAEPDGRLHLVATGRDDRRRHVVDVEPGELGDPEGLRARCGAAVARVVPGVTVDGADCPLCTAGGQIDPIVALTNS